MPSSTLGQKCFCGALFGTHQHLADHADSKGHRHRCSCSLLFKALSAVVEHQNQVNDAGTPGGTELPALVALAQNPAIDAVADNVCVVCRKPYANADGVKAHKADKHPECPTCHEIFVYVELLTGHQRSTGHCYCDQHRLAFRDSRSFKAHVMAEKHVTGFECIPCDREFGSEHALNDHLAVCTAAISSTAVDHGNNAAAFAAFAAVEEENLRCEACNKTFKNLHAQRQHKKSTKHHPLSEFRCYLSSECKQTFTSPSAYMFHLESGKCKSGMTRQKLNDIVHTFDTDHHITYAENATRSISGDSLLRQAVSGAVQGRDLTSALSRLSISSSHHSGVILTPAGSDASSTATATGGGVVLTPDSSDTETVLSDAGGVILTPSNSSSGSISSTQDDLILTPSTASRARSEWSFVTDTRLGHSVVASVDGSSVSTITYDTARKVWPCSLCTRTFQKKKHLLQHLNSPFHAPKLFHSPPAAVLGLSSRKPPKAFKTLSGFTQHIETCACVGGKETLKQLVSIVEGTVKSATGRDVKLLRDS